jgi:hypothetical protein
VDPETAEERQGIRVPVRVAVAIPAVDGREAAVDAQAAPVVDGQAAPVVDGLGVVVLARAQGNLPAEREAAGIGRSAGNAPSATTGAAIRSQRVFARGGQLPRILLS